MLHTVSRSMLTDWSQATAMLTTTRIHIAAVLLLASVTGEANIPHESLSPLVSWLKVCTATTVNDSIVAHHLHLFDKII